MPLITFNPVYGSGITVAPTAVSAASTITTGTSALCLSNLGAVTVYIRVGETGITTTTADYPVPPYSQVSITRFADHDTIAYVTASGTGSLNVIAGEGL